MSGHAQPHIATELQNLAPGDSIGLALRLTGAANLRDLGGYRTAAGHRVSRGIVFRSDVFHPLTADDTEKLSRIGFHHVYDLRTAPEIAVRPNQLPASVNIVSLNVLADAQSAAPTQLEALLRVPKEATASLTAGGIEGLFARIYRDFVSLPSAKAAYRRLFLGLADSAKRPAVFHCTAGKDRTGWAAAALLSLVGVPQETVMDDYLRTNEYLLPSYQSKIDRFASAGGDSAILTAILSVKREYLEASFAEMQARYGTVENYFTNGLGIDAEIQSALRDMLLSKL